MGGQGEIALDLGGDEAREGASDSGQDGGVKAQLARRLQHSP